MRDEHGIVLTLLPHGNTLKLPTWIGFIHEEGGNSSTFAVNFSQRNLMNFVNLQKKSGTPFAGSLDSVSAAFRPAGGHFNKLTFGDRYEQTQHPP